MECWRDMRIIHKSNNPTTEAKNTYESKARKFQQILGEEMKWVPCANQTHRAIYVRLSNPLRIGRCPNRDIRMSRIGRSSRPVRIGHPNRDWDWKVALACHGLDLSLIHI